MWISPKDLAELAGVSCRATNKALAIALSRGTPWRGVTLNVRQRRGRGGDGGKGYEVHVDSLPVELQARWNAQRAAPSLAEKSAATSAPGREGPQLPWTTEKREARHAAFARRPSLFRAAAYKKLQALHSVRLYRLAASAVESYQRAAREAGVATSTVYEWAAICKGLDPGDWLVALGRRSSSHQQKRAPFTPEAWEWFQGEYLLLTKPALAPIYRRGLDLAPERGWAIPSYATVRQMILALPHWMHVLYREGPAAFERMYRPLDRDYSTLRLHQCWNSDGRKTDVFLLFEDGTVGRGMFMAWMDLRTRYFPGWVLAKSESFDAARQALRNAIEGARGALPDEVLLDNGMAFAAKQMSGGAPTRFRGKVMEDDLEGILLVLGVPKEKIRWALPGHGRSKPVESAWNVLSEMDRQFPGAYCGNKPGARPEDFDRSKAVPIATYRAKIKETLRLYHAKRHSGDSMDDRSPLEVYNELLPSAVVRQVTREQLRQLMQVSKKVTLNKKDHSFTILENPYWCEQLGELSPKDKFFARYNPENATEPAALYRLSGEFLFDVPMISKTGFFDQAAAKTHALAKGKYIKARKAESAALAQMIKTRDWRTLPDSSEPKSAPPASAGALPAPKVATTVRPRIDFYPKGKPRQEDKITAEQFSLAAAAGLLMTRKSGTR